MKKALLFTLLVILALSLAACGAPAEDAPAETQEASAYTTFVSDGFGDVTYRMFSTWDKEPDSDVSVLYHPAYDYPTIANFWMESADGIVSFNSEADRQHYIERYKEGAENYQEVSTETMTIADQPGLHHKYTCDADGSTLEGELYAFVYGTQIYCFANMIYSDASPVDKAEFSRDFLGLIISVETTPASEPSGTVQTADTTEPTGTESITMGMKNALSSAQTYLKTMPFSYDGLIEQLEYEQYTHEEAVYAADNCGADWNEQAALAAANYLNVMSFSRQGLIDQLVYDGYTTEQAVYGVEQNGY